MSSLYEECKKLWEQLDKRSAGVHIHKDRVSGTIEVGRRGGQLIMRAYTYPTDPSRNVFDLFTPAGHQLTVHADPAMWNHPDEAVVLNGTEAEVRDFLAQYMR